MVLVVYWLNAVGTGVIWSYKTNLPANLDQ